jgi:hypothetical protein
VRCSPIGSLQHEFHTVLYSLYLQLSCRQALLYDGLRGVGLISDSGIRFLGCGFEITSLAATAQFSIATTGSVEMITAVQSH